MVFFSRRIGIKRYVLPALAAVVVAASGTDAGAQGRRRAQDAPPPAPLPQISEAQGRCSFAFHEAMTRIETAGARDLSRFESLARVTDPMLAGRWNYWVKTAKNARAPTTEQVCAETAIRNGRERCVRWQAKPIDPVIVGAQPTADELAVLRSLDGFVTDKGALLEFGPNGRNFVVLQRYAGEMGNYIAQPRHPALCNGATHMLDFQATNLAPFRKRVEDVAALKVKAAAFARQRVAAARAVRVAEAEAAAAAATPSATPVSGDAAAGIGASSPPVLRPPAAPRGAVPETAGVGELIDLTLEGLLSPDRQQALAAETNPLRKLVRAREMVTGDALAGSGASTRASVGAALRMIEAMAYADMQAARMKPFEDLFLGTIDKLRAAHAANCTCGEN